MRGVEIIEAPAKSVLNRVAGMPFPWSINPYRGCYHQCVFCYARRTHTFLEDDGIERWGTRIYVKTNAPAVLRTELAKRSWSHETVAIGTVTDPYQLRHAREPHHAFAARHTRRRRIAPVGARRGRKRFD